MKEDIIEIIIKHYLVDERVRDIVAQYKQSSAKRVVYDIIKDNYEDIMKELIILE